MIGRLRTITGHWVVAVGIILTGLLSGCQTGPKFSDLPPETGNMLHVGDSVTVSFVTIEGDDKAIPEHPERIHEDGTITLSLIGSVTAVGKTVGQLQKEIHDLYVPKYFPELTVTVRGEQRYFYVDGEVHSSGQKEYPGDMSVVKAISVAGGFTDFANKKSVRLTRAGHTQVINVDKANKDPKYDTKVYPGDTILVKRRIF